MRLVLSAQNSPAVAFKTDAKMLGQSATAVTLILVQVPPVGTLTVVSWMTDPPVPRRIRILKSWLLPTSWWMKARAV